MSINLQIVHGGISRFVYKREKILKSVVFESFRFCLCMIIVAKKVNCTQDSSVRNLPFEVWDILLQIPYGKTTTYGEIAAVFAKRRGILRMSAQAVGGAVGHNPVSIIIPCHRVVGHNGNLTGYAGGIDRKIKLLEIEQADVSDKLSLR